jgi:hypothetical protein
VPPTIIRPSRAADLVERLAQKLLVELDEVRIVEAERLARPPTGRHRPSGCTRPLLVPRSAVRVVELIVALLVVVQPKVSGLSRRATETVPSVEESSEPTSSA